VRKTCFSTALLLTGSLAWSQATPKNILERFPESEDKETVTSTCSACHTLARVAANNRDKAQWTQTIKAHNTRGLKLEQDEIDVVVRYLSTYFGPKVYLNTATAEELTALPHIDKKLADTLISYRQQHGPFKSPDDVVNVIGADTFAQVKNRLVTGASEK
jgi:competence ComEA-like helix-hairpin-helix protein